MKPLLKTLPFLLFILTSLSVSCEKEEDGGNAVTMWLSTPDQTALLEELSTRVELADPESDAPTITVNSSVTYQEMDGFGFSMTGGSAIVLRGMSASARTDILRELFGTDSNSIGVSYLRVSIGASDLDPQPFSYNDLPPGQTDINLEQFSIDPDRTHLIPVLKEVLEINPDIKIMGSPWSAPAWMKVNADASMPSRGGSLNPDYHAVYAQYFVKYIQAMEAEGITIDAITIQNEPHHAGNNPSMYMDAPQQAEFIKTHLGPAFESAGITTKIIIWDHNCDNPGYPISILNDAAAKAYVDGSAFHLYGGDISALSTVHDAHPDKNLYFTEQWIGAPGNFPADLQWHTRNLTIGAVRNWSRVVLQWNLAADQNQDPHTSGGCTQCLGGLTIIGNQVRRNPAYYIIGHVGRFVRPGSVRIQSNVPDGLPNVAYRNSEGDIVLLLLNDSGANQSFNISVDGTNYTTSMIEGSVATIVFEQ